ncbi:MAG: DUF805 domain-containing protein [Alphaproteobacteria bacterium HGW-Alphaproteobacteria-7]|jgi:uncharacterized membrane protein YhaH (DUF805 family)|nr:MAG: DUF805 domain-containing protein [Alphaproteobacteria bacterium HGW-Alphaproteobacteria-7]
MIESIRYCLANLANFDGRDTRPTFWYYVLLLVVINVVISVIISGIIAANSIGTMFESTSDGINEAAMMQQMAESLPTQAWIGAAISLVTLGLYIATFVRRLRDAALPIAIAAIPVATTLFTVYNSISSASTMQAIMATGNLEAFNEAALSSAALGMISWLGYLVVIICGALPSKAG